MKSRQRIYILQHPKEAQHAKNTVRLLSLCLEHIEIFIGEHPDDFAALRSQVEQQPQTFQVFYPHQNSQSFEARFTVRAPTNLIFIDATWRKAFRMWQLNPWLHLCHGWHFETPPASRYAIRQTRIEGGISTLEAVAYALEQGFGEDATPLMQAFEAMQAHQLRHRAD